MTTPPEKHKMEPKDYRIAFLVSIYSIIVFVVAIYFLIDVWPATAEEFALNATRSVTLYPIGTSFNLPPETSLIFIMICSAIIGACTFSLFAISHHLGVDKDFDRMWLGWYLFRPLIGSGFALLFYFLLRGGVLTIGSDLENLNLLGVAAISGMVGMFSEHAMHKLQDLADTLFGPAPGTNKTVTT